MPSSPFDTKRIGSCATATAPDGASVHVLCALAGGSTASFGLPPGAVSRAVAHRTVEEIWYVAAGAGRLWRRHGDVEEITALAPGTSLTIPLGTFFQFRCDGAEALAILALTMPPWPGADEAYPTDGVWQAQAPARSG